MATATARITTRRRRPAYELLTGPQAGITYYASDQPLAHHADGEEVRVTYEPEDQFARLAEDAFIERALAAAQRHGEESEPDMEVGDLQGLAYLMWKHLTPAARAAVIAEATLWGEDDD